MEIALWIDTPALGDTIAAIPTLRKLSEAYGNEPITVFTTKPFLFDNHPLVKQAFKSDADKSDYIIYRTFSPLVGKSYDLNGQITEFRYSNMDFRQFHAVSLGFTLKESEMGMDLYIEKPRELPVKDYVIIHPTHTWPTRTWEQEKWQELIDRLNERGIPVVAVGRDSKEVGFFNVQKPVMPIDIKLGVNLLNDDDNDPAELRWMMNHRARAVVTMDSGMLHIAGTTDVNIIQLGSSIDNKLRAPYRGPNTSQEYKYAYVGGGCSVFCSSNMKSNVQVHGSINGVPPQVSCLENRPTFECHPGVDAVFRKVIEKCSESIGQINYKGRSASIYNENKDHYIIPHKNIRTEKVILFIAPHLSTGGMPEFLLERVRALAKYKFFNAHVLEYCKYSNAYTVQRDKIIETVGPNRFHEIALLGEMEASERGGKMIELIKGINPDIIHIEECPEAFDSFNTMDYPTQKWIYDNNRHWKIVETCHNIWFRPKGNKKFYPNAFATVSPEHTKNTFAFSPSIRDEIQFPIKVNKKSESIRRSFLNDLGFNPDSGQYHIINVGLWTSGKNQGELIEWARVINKEYPGIYQFHFIGNQAENFNDYWGPLMENLPDNISIHGERNDVDSFYHIADLVSFNSKIECNPLAIRQSIGWDIPLMARNLPQYHEIYKGKIVEISDDISENINSVKDSCNKPGESDNSDPVDRFKNNHIDLYEKIINNENERKSDIGVNTDEWKLEWNSGPIVTAKTENTVNVEFMIDGVSNYKSTLKGIGHWTRPNTQYWSNWEVIINGISYKLDMKSPQIITFDSSSLGDTLSFIEPCVEYKRKWGMSKLYIATYKNWLFDKEHYKKMGIEFIEISDQPWDSVATWRIGVYMEEPGGKVWFPNKNKRDWRKIYLGDIASDFVGVDQAMRPPKLIYSGKINTDIPYICIATESTAQAKYWNNPTGWQDLTNYYINKGYIVYNISKEPRNIKGVTECDKDLDAVYKLLQGAEIFYGISSGLSWFAWCTDVLVVLISGFTPESCEYNNEKTLRIINKSVCNSCWSREHFNRGDWNWCPDHKDTPRQFECTKTITAESVIEQVESRFPHLVNI
jgi:autotransporter strand-loop-strand O-heptosyltransferase